MNLREQARQDFHDKEKDRVAGWTSYMTPPGKSLSAFLREPFQLKAENLRSPLDEDELVLSLDWLRSGVVMEVVSVHESHPDESDPPLQLFARQGDDSTADDPTVEVYLVGPCRNCGDITALSPQLSGDEPLGPLGEAEALRAPVATHECR